MSTADTLKKLVSESSLPWSRGKGVQFGWSPRLVDLRLIRVLGDIAKPLAEWAEAWLALPVDIRVQRGIEYDLFNAIARAVERMEAKP